MAAGPRSPWPATTGGRQPGGRAAAAWGSDDPAGLTRSASPAAARSRRCSRRPTARRRSGPRRHRRCAAVRRAAGPAPPRAAPVPAPGFPDVADRQAADHHVERRGRKREVTRVRVDKLHLVAHALGHRVALRGGAAVAALVAEAPYVRPANPVGAENSAVGVIWGLPMGGRG